MQKRKNTLVRQKEIVSAARKLIVKYGSENVTIKKMAKEIGVSEGAIYRHFKSKRDVLLLMIEDIQDTLIEDIDKHCLGGIGSLEVLERIILEHVSAIDQRRGVAFQVIAEVISKGDKKLNKKIFDLISKYTSRIRGILEDGINTGVIRPDIDLDATARLFFGMTQGLVNIWALSQYSFNLQDAYKPLWSIFVTGITQSQARM
jgi:AcrR family transcriptional regulator